MVDLTKLPASGVGLQLAWLADGGRRSIESLGVRVSKQLERKGMISTVSPRLSGQSPSSAPG